MTIRVEETSRLIEAMTRRPRGARSRKIGSPLLDMIGNTPMLRIGRLLPQGSRARIFVKAEWLNPSGSIKDRSALEIIRDGESCGSLLPGKTIIDATSGNAGIAYAMIAGQLGYPVKIVLPGDATEERKRLLSAYGAELVLTDPAKGSDGSQEVVTQIVADSPGKYFYANQYNNPAEWKAHYETTALEIWRQTRGRITHFVSTVGTGGTFVGVSRRLKELNPRIRCLITHPQAAHPRIPGMRYLPSGKTPGIFDPTLADGYATVSHQSAMDTLLLLAKKEGLMLGHSSGANVAAALKIANESPRGIIVTICADSGARYLSSEIWSNRV